MTHAYPQGKNSDPYGGLTVRQYYKAAAITGLLAKHGLDADSMRPQAYDEEALVADAAAIADAAVAEDKETVSRDFIGETEA